MGRRSADKVQREERAGRPAGLRQSRPAGTVWPVRRSDGPSHSDSASDPGPGSTGGGFGSFRHLAGRFFGALDPRGPAPEEESWALGWMLPGEQALWRRMSGPDRRHAAGVAREVADRLGDPSREVMAAALLHDVGKVESGLGTFARVWVTFAAMAAGRANVPGKRARLYLDHDKIGAALLSRAGSHDLTVSWALEHHLPEQRWTVDRRLAVALKEADGD